jgi:ATP-binding cassette subfamily C (CFTR/MRP) protein 1
MCSPICLCQRLTLCRYYLATSRELKRLDAVSKSPIFAWFSESLNGLSTIRGFAQQKIFIAGIEKRIDRNQMCYLPSVSCNRWLAVRLEFIGSIIILVTALVSLWKLATTGVDAGLVGLVLSYGLNVTGSLVCGIFLCILSNLTLLQNWAVRSASELEQNLVSVERILHYVHLEPEAPYRIPGSDDLSKWPAKGSIEFR